MPPKEERIRQLLEGHLQGRLTEPEQMELFQAILGDEPSFRRIAGDLYAGFTGSADGLDAASREAILSAIFAAGKNAGEPAVSPAKRRPLYALSSRWFRYAAAILVILGLGLALYYVVSPRTKAASEQAQTIGKTDIAPGGNKAVLTLGNGSRIILDSAANGTIASEGSARISKLTGGLLAYNVSTEKTVDVFYNTLTTPRGGQFQLRLPDGTKVWLNAASSITYPTAFAGKERRVTVTGEVYFEVVHNDKKPFLVETGGQIIKDIGTAFNVNAYGDEDSIQTTLLEGSVEVSTGRDSRIIKPGQQAVAAGSDSKIVLAAGVDLEKVMAWKNGEMVLGYGNVKKLMLDISRWYNVDIEYAHGVPEGRFFGYIDRNVPLSSVLKALKAYGIETRLEKNKLIVL